MKRNLDCIVAFLKEHGKVIVLKSTQGDRLCKKIVNMYTMLHKSPKDTAVHGIIEIFLEEYAEREKIPFV